MFTTFMLAYTVTVAEDDIRSWVRQVDLHLSMLIAY